MRLGNLILWDIKLQVKYGFYYLYTVLTVLYLIILLTVPNHWREKLSAILIFSDPATMGLFFMGAIVLLEKSQRVPCAYAVSPVKATEYIISKVVSLCIISTVVGAVLASTSVIERLPLVMIGTMLASIIFTLLGIIISTKITSLNQFILYTVPIEVIGFGPAILHMFGVSPVYLRYYPASLCMDMILGKSVSILGLLIVMLVIGVLFCICRQSILKMWGSEGGVKL